MSVDANISLEVLLHLNVLSWCLILIIRHKVCKSPGLRSLCLTLVVSLIYSYFRLVDLNFVKVRWLATFVQLQIVLILVLWVLKIWLSFEIVLTFICILFLLKVFLFCEEILILYIIWYLEIIVGVYITIIGNAYGLSLKSIRLDDVWGLKRVLNWV
jgi:hypothetical protein